MSETVAISIVALGVGVALLIYLRWLFEQPFWGWAYAASFAFNAIVLIPIWIASWFAARFEPELWSQADSQVYIFSAVFVLPTALCYFLWQRALKLRDQANTDSN